MKIKDISRRFAKAWFRIVRVNHSVDKGKIMVDKGKIMAEVGKIMASKRHQKASFWMSKEQQLEACLKHKGLSIETSLLHKEQQLLEHWLRELQAFEF